LGGDIDSGKQGDGLIHYQIHDVALALRADQFKANRLATACAAGIIFEPGKRAAATTFCRSIRSAEEGVSRAISWVPVFHLFFTQAMAPAVDLEKRPGESASSAWTCSAVDGSTGSNRQISWSSWSGPRIATIVCPSAGYYLVLSVPIQY
jgi:hypothetical protein